MQNTSNPFTGTGVFTSNHPEKALDYAGRVDWVAIQPAFATPEIVQKFKDSGVKVVIWEDEASQRGVDAVNWLKADGYIAQAEGPGQMEAAKNVAEKIAVPKAMVTNLYNQNSGERWDNQWICMPEAYQNVNPNASPETMVGVAKNMGADNIIPVLGTYDGASEGGIKKPLKEYFSGLQTAGSDSYALFTAESLEVTDQNDLAKGGVPSALPPVEDSTRQLVDYSADSPLQAPVIAESSPSAAGGHIVDNGSDAGPPPAYAPPPQAPVIAESSPSAAGGHVVDDSLPYAPRPAPQTDSQTPSGGSPFPPPPPNDSPMPDYNVDPDRPAGFGHVL